MSKDTAYSARMKSSEDYLGGAAAIARHLASFVDNLRFLFSNENSGLKAETDKSLFIPLVFHPVILFCITFSFWKYTNGLFFAKRHRIL